MFIVNPENAKMQSMLYRPQAAWSILKALKTVVIGPIDRIARAADVAGVLSQRPGARGKDLHSSAPLTAARWEPVAWLASWRPSRIRSCFRSLNRLT